MPSKQSRGKHVKPIKEIDEVPEDIELIKQEPNNEEEEEEYDPEEVFDEDEESEEEEKIDVSKLSPRQKQDIDRSNRRVLFLKALAVDVYQHVTKLAKKCGITPNDGNNCISVFLGVLAHTKDDQDFPARLLKYFNTLVPEGYPNKVKLDHDDVNELINLVQVYQDKLQNAAKITDPDKYFGKEDIKDAKTINDSMAQKKVIMSDSSQPQPQPNSNSQPYQYQFTTPQYDRNSMDFYVNKYANPDIGLLEMVLNMVPNPRPNSIGSFIHMFTDLYMDWMANPLKMLEQLKFTFGPTHGEHMFRAWRDYRDKFQKQQGYSPVTGTEYSPYSFSQPLQPNYAAAPELEAERMQDKRMNKLMQILQMRMMDKAMEAQTPTPIAGQNYEEILDQNGKVIKRIFISNGHANNSSNPLETTMITTLTTIFKEMLGGANAEKVELLKRISTPDNTLQDLAKTMISNTLNNQNPVQLATQYMEVAKMFNDLHGKQGGDTQKSIEAVKLDVDSKIAMQELELKKLEMQHNWRMDEKQTAEQDSNVDKWLNVLQQMGTDIVKPIAIKFVEGLGKGNVPGAPLGGMFAGGGQATPQDQQAQAMAEQQYYQAQQQAEYGRPMQPMGPIGGMGPNPSQQQQQPPHRQYNPNQYTPPQQQKPVSQLSERELQEQLDQLSPEQVQELEDKMMIDDMNRERIKNALRAHKNARRFSHRAPSTPQQVQEAQQVLNPNAGTDITEDDLLGEEEDDFEDEEEYEVPIAAGQDRTIAANTEAQKPRKFSEFEQESTTETVRKKKLTKQQEAMLAEGQLSPSELRHAENKEDIDDFEDDGYDSSSVPIAGIRNASDDALVEENLKQTKQVPKKKKSNSSKKAKEEKEEIDEQYEKNIETIQNEVREMEKEEIEELPEDEFKDL